MNNAKVSCWSRFVMLLLVPFFFLVVPVVVSAQTNFFFTLRPYIVQLLEIIFLLLPFALTLSVLFFLWGLAQFVYRAGDIKEHENGRRIMVWGVIAIFVFVSIFGIMEVILQTFNLDVAGPRLLGVVGIPTVPQVLGPSMRGGTFRETVMNDLYPLAQLFTETLVLGAWLVFFYGIARFVWSLSSGDEEGIGTGKIMLVWGTIILTVAMSVWGFVWLLAAAFGFTGGGPSIILFPQFRESAF